MEEQAARAFDFFRETEDGHIVLAKDHGPTQCAGLVFVFVGLDSDSESFGRQAVVSDHFVFRRHFGRHLELHVPAIVVFERNCAFAQISACRESVSRLAVLDRNCWHRDARRRISILASRGVLTLVALLNLVNLQCVTDHTTFKSNENGSDRAVPQQHRGCCI